MQKIAKAKSFCNSMHKELLVSFLFATLIVLVASIITSRDNVSIGFVIAALVGFFGFWIIILDQKQNNKQAIIWALITNLIFSINVLFTIIVIIITALEIKELNLIPTITLFILNLLMPLAILQLLLKKLPKTPLYITIILSLILTYIIVAPIFILIIYL